MGVAGPPPLHPGPKNKARGVGLVAPFDGHPPDPEPSLPHRFRRKGGVAHFPSHPLFFAARGWTPPAVPPFHPSCPTPPFPFSKPLFSGVLFFPLSACFRITPTRATLPLPIAPNVSPSPRQDGKDHFERSLIRSLPLTPTCFSSASNQTCTFGWRRINRRG